MNTFLILAWGGAAFLSLGISASHDPVLAEQLKKLESTSKTDQGYSLEIQQNETEAQKTIDTLAPLLTRVNWFPVCLASSFFAFAFLGFCVAQLMNSSDWLGILPLLAILSSSSPPLLCSSLASHGITTAALSPIENIVVVAAQIVAVYGVGALGLNLKNRRLARQHGLIPPAPPSAD